MIKINPDKQKAKSLHDMSLITLERLKETELEKYPSNSLTDYYDIVRKLMEALNFLEGVKIKGEGAHLKIIDHVCKKYNLSESTRIFLQEMRDYRNRISYEGFYVNKNYISLNKDKIESIINQLNNLIIKSF